MNTPPTHEEQPDVTLVQWGVMQLNYGGYHLVGLHADTLEPRVTSMIKAVHLVEHVVRTRSGRRYHLRGPADDETAARLIHDYIRQHGLTVHDVALADWSEVLMLTDLPLQDTEGGIH